MASLWQKTLFYLGLVDDEQADGAENAVARTDPTAKVRTVEPVERPVAPGTTDEPELRQIRTGGGTVAGRRIEPPATSTRRMSSNPSLAEAGVYIQEPGGVRSGESEIIVADTFADAQNLADHLRQGVPVVLDLRGTEPAMVRRLVDFSTGLTYALDGRMAKIGQGVILITPPHGVIGVEEQQRLVDLGLYQARGD